MINLEQKYTPRVNPGDADYPFGSIKGASSPGAGDGTPLSSSWGNDIEGFRQAVMTEAGVAPSGQPDNAHTSQLWSAMKDVLRQEVPNMGWTPVEGSFELGGTITARNQILWWEAAKVWYSWQGVIPVGGYVVAAGSTPATSGGVSTTAWVDRTDGALRDELASDGGAGFVGIDMLAAYQLGTVGAQLVPVPNADNTGTVDCTSAFNSKLQQMALDGGGVLKPVPGTYKILGTLLLPSNTVIDLTGVTLTGSGSNNIIENAALIGGVLTSIISEHGTGFDGNGTHATFGSALLNGVLANAARGIRGHRMNFGCRIEGTFFASSLGVAWEICHSWGMKITSCTVYAPAKNYNFVDWTEISGNSFEGLTSDDSNSYGLEISGGSYSLSVHSNGFHHLTTAIRLNGELTNTVITSNHFEDCRYHVVGDEQTKAGLQIHSNWMKANLSTPASNVISVALTNSKFGKIGPNFYTTDGISGFDAHVVCNATDCVGNEIVVDHSIGSSVDLLKYQVSITNKIVATGGSNNATVSQPWIETLAGSSGYTMEKYRSRYHDVPNSIPLCSVAYVGTVITIDTFVTTDNFGGSQLVAYNIMVKGSVSNILAGHICHGVVKEIVNAEYYSGGSPLTMAITNNAGFMRITITGAPSGGTVTGWVKEI